MADICSIFALKPVKAYRDSKALPQPFPDPSLIMGVELEIEGIVEQDYPPSFKSVEDGSLRNNGREFVSAPMTYSVLHAALTQFFKMNKLTDYNYSERTSIHVHCNCQDLSMQQLASLLLLYQVFERMLFQFVGGDRDKNIFCVPLYECALSYSAVTRLEAEEQRIISDWSKYSALNLLPILTQGTVEFRHMPGTNNMQKITKWLQLIGCLFATARKYSLEEIKEMFINLNTTSQYRKVTDVVFGEHANAWEHYPYEALLEDGVLNMKYSLIKRQAVTISPARLNAANLWFDPNEAIAQDVVRWNRGEHVDNVRQRIRDLVAAGAVRPRAIDPVAPINEFNAVEEENF